MFLNVQTRKLCLQLLSVWIEEKGISRDTEIKEFLLILILWNFFLSNSSQIIKLWTKQKTIVRLKLTNNFYYIKTAKICHLQKCCPGAVVFSFDQRIFYKFDATEYNVLLFLHNVIFFVNIRIICTVFIPSTRVQRIEIKLKMLTVKNVKMAALSRINSMKNYSPRNWYAPESFPYATSF